MALGACSATSTRVTGSFSGSSIALIATRYSLDDDAPSTAGTAVNNVWSHHSGCASSSPGWKYLTVAHNFPSATSRSIAWLFGAALLADMKTSARQAATDIRRTVREL